MDYVNNEKNRADRNVGKKNGQKKEEKERIYGITKPGKYYFPGKISSGCFDGNGFLGEVERQKREKRVDELYDYSVDRQFDTNGMYTGRPENNYEVPTQDADDL